MHKTQWKGGGGLNKCFVFLSICCTAILGFVVVLSKYVVKRQYRRVTQFDEKTSIVVNLSFMEQTVPQ